MYPIIECLLNCYKSINHRRGPMNRIIFSFVMMNKAFEMVLLDEVITT